MIGQTTTEVQNDMHKELTAIKDAIVVFLLVLVSNLVTAGYPPSGQVLYSSALAGLLAGLTSYAYTMGIKKKESETK